MRKFLLGIAIASLFALNAEAASLPLLTGPVTSEPSQVQNSLNTVIQSINNGVTGQLGSLVTPFTSSGTSLQTAWTYIMPGGQMNTVGQIFHIKCAGLNSADANAKTVTFSFGGQTQALIVTGSGNNWTADFWVMKVGANAQTAWSTAQTAATPVAVNENTGWTVTDTASITVLVEATPATGGTMTFNACEADQAK